MSPSHDSAFDLAEMKNTVGSTAGASGEDLVTSASEDTTTDAADGLVNARAQVDAVTYISIVILFVSTLLIIVCLLNRVWCRKRKRNVNTTEDLPPSYAIVMKNSEIFYLKPKINDKLDLDLPSYEEALQIGSQPIELQIKNLCVGVIVDNSEIDNSINQLSDPLENPMNCFNSQRAKELSAPRGDSELSTHYSDNELSTQPNDNELSTHYRDNELSTQPNDNEGNTRSDDNESSTHL